MLHVCLHQDCFLHQPEGAFAQRLENGDVFPFNLHRLISRQVRNRLQHWTIRYRLNQIQIHVVQLLLRELSDNWIDAALPQAKQDHEENRNDGHEGVKENMEEPTLGLGHFQVRHVEDLVAGDGSVVDMCGDVDPTESALDFDVFDVDRFLVLQFYGILNMN